MTRGLFNWNYNDVVSVLRAHGFSHNHSRGSHQYFIGNVGGKLQQVEVPYHGAKTFKPRTVKGMLLQSGLTKKDWGIE